jgi:hypothetical protein
MLLLLLPMLFARLKGRKLVIDRPNPVSAALSELRASASNPLTLAVRRAWLYLSFPLSLYPAHRILAYSPDHRWFTFGARSKIHLIGNSVDTRDVACRRMRPDFDGTRLRLIGVGHLAFWHGYDRLIRSIHQYVQAHGESAMRVEFVVVGDGFELTNLITLVRQLKLQGLVRFCGTLVGLQLEEEFEQAHVAIGGLGQHRKNLYVNSELKTKDYVARGLPFLLAYEDPDFPAGTSFVFRCPGDESVIDLAAVARWYAGLAQDPAAFRAIRQFAEQRLDYRARLSRHVLSLLRPEPAAAVDP